MRGTEARQRRTLIATGAIVAAVATVVVLVMNALPERPQDNSMDVVLSTPIVGQGIAVDSKVLMRGVPVGVVTALDKHGGTVNVRLRLDENQTRGLTDGFGFDFRPANSFGLSALSITPRDGGVPLVDGQVIDRSPDVNATMSQMLNGQVTLITSVVNDKLIELMKHSADYLTALAPMIEGGLTLTNVLADTQRTASDVLLAKANHVLEPMPELLDATLPAIQNFRHLKGWQLPMDNDRAMESLVLIDDGVFGPLSDIVKNDKTALLPATEIARSMADAVSALVQRSRGSLRWDKLLAGLRDTYSGPEGAKTAKVRLILEPLPALQAVMQEPSDLDGNRTR
ncbi:MlaD family protein [Mycolicibacterium sp. CBMA 234]|uniref:MlaD family protein n=1 Tax=Mycolicibacterium sp. CBMA 234 TaxID=1918495 RepID=UPI001391AD29|nr:MlaD family protein [Mycolicibacterium sp. CBMA 234]